MKKVFEIKYTQRKEECHYEATLWHNKLSGGWYPFLFGYGFSQPEADTNLIKQINIELLKNK